MAEAQPHKQTAAALGRVPSGLFILTARHRDAETGMLTSWVQQCALEPLMVSVALKHDRAVHDWLRAGALFNLNILEDGQTDMIVHFGRGFELDQPAFVGLDVERSGSGIPVLSEALAYLECRVVNRCRAGDHELLLAEVLAGRLLNEGHPLVHVRKSGTHY